MVSPMTNFSNPKLSKRLEHFAQFYQDQSFIWDIGCDHAQLGLSFVNHPAAPQIHLVDPALAVIKNLKKKIKDSDIPRAQIFHQKGQEVLLDPTSSHFIFIAGMGGYEIISILEKIFPQLTDDDQMLISPHTKVLEVREFLQRQGPCLQKEGVIYDSGIWYPHFLLSKKGRVVSSFGDELFQGENGKQYRQFLLEKLTRHRDERSLAYLNFLKSF